MQELSGDIESKILNDLDDKMHGLEEMTIDRPELAEIFDRDAATQSPKLAFAMYLLHLYGYAFQMRQTKVLRDNKWDGWIQSMRGAFKGGTIGDY